MGGQWKGGYRDFGLDVDGVGYAVNDYNRSLIEDVMPQVDELKQKIINGEIVVPTNNEELQTFQLHFSQLGLTGYLAGSPFFCQCYNEKAECQVSYKQIVVSAIIL